MRLLWNSSFLTSCLLHISLIGICILGDKFVEIYSTFKVSRSVLVLVDNGCHAIVGIFTWAIVTNATELGESFLCGMLASLIDVDHFIAAGSLQLKDALNLPLRPLFHNTFLLLIPFVACAVANVVIASERIHRFAWLYLAAVLSHHIRDGYRRGIWLGPLGTIPPYPYYMYLVALTVLPMGIKFFVVTRSTSVDTTSIV